ncbi:hypothetical protein DDV21_001110 [Streptococcus chenjunshii]|uniref:Uncharacterized protein n=1 Tax=Streptococcus chenjunshii TaxID=2173853 RepID=A0A372KKC0_9STRE|nr:hypothetical protein [Streptococcus chenjunshii]AXQ77770.1 hypothetical protein DDV21_001110 [Streptococcus chenjunshii]RFU50492.1 hypothetical protein DDV22_08445 [Streptococcus chenjunshii]RFU52720.1 hypothetical protein DDV23_08285 [Streptococcus chenjunshii]
MELILMSLSVRYNFINVPEKFNRPIQRQVLRSGYEELYLLFYDFELVKDLIDYWGLLYIQPKKDLELKYVEQFSMVSFNDGEHRQNAVKKAARQEARQRFYDELTVKPLKLMSVNVRWVAELLVKTGYAELVL